MAKVTDKVIDTKAREVALQIEQLMAVVDFKYNRHQKCLVCNHKYRHHLDGLPCLSDNNKKKIINKDKWGNIKPKG
jgi:hypothetical protein|tara:strand:- start:17135 stop:17362 length:228 start_codon:yes stop_codon:yes gene_type:complete